MLDENPSSKVAACLVALTRIARPEGRIYTRRVALRRSGATVCRPVGRLSKQNQEPSLGNLLRQHAHQPEWAHHTIFFPAPSVAARGERAATSVRRLLDPARSLENGRSLYWVAFHLRSPSLQAVWVGVTFFPLHCIFGATRVQPGSCKRSSSRQVACEGAIKT